MTHWQPYRESIFTTLSRTVTLAVIGGALLARAWGSMRWWPAGTVVALWPAFGGHWVELAFLNGLRPRLPEGRAAQVVARVAVWFVGGIVLATGTGLTAFALGLRPARWSTWGPPWWVGGLGFIGIELVAHVALMLRGRPNVYDGRG